jgi:hypothetical protein
MGQLTAPVSGLWKPITTERFTNQQTVTFNDVLSADYQVIMIAGQIKPSVDGTQAQLQLGKNGTYQTGGADYWNRTQNTVSSNQSYTNDGMDLFYFSTAQEMGAASGEAGCFRAYLNFFDDAAIQTMLEGVAQYSNETGSNESIILNSRRETTGDHTDIRLVTDDNVSGIITIAGLRPL